MPVSAKGARLWLRKERRDDRGRITHPAVYVIRDDGYQESTGCGRHDRAGAERALEAYLNRKHTAQAKKSVRDPDQIPVADVLGMYAAEIAPRHARPKETLQRIERLLAFFGADMLFAINGDRCRAFARSRSTPTAAREDLSVLRAAINHHRQEGHCDKIVSVVLPERAAGRDRWCTLGRTAAMVGLAFPRGAKGHPYRSPHPARCSALHFGCALYWYTRRRRLRGSARTHRGKGMDRS
jgi:hypothetical protein